MCDDAFDVVVDPSLVGWANAKKGVREERSGEDDRQSTSLPANWPVNAVSSVDGPHVVLVIGR
jgi:hypothetical protein